MVKTQTRRYASINEAAEYIGSSSKTISRLVGAGKLTRYALPGKQRARIVRVDLNELDALLNPAFGGGPSAA